MSWQEKINQIWQGDCLELMKEMPDGVIDMVLTSPPYDNLRDYKGYTFDFEGVAKELFRIVKGGGVVVWVVNDAVIKGSESGTSFRQSLYFKEIGFNLHDTMIYDKNGCPFPDRYRYNQVFEYMFILSKGTPKTINLICDKKNTYANAKIARAKSDRQKNGELKPNSAFKNNRKKTIKDVGFRNNIWRISTSASEGNHLKTQHPATFPDALAKDHIISWSNENDLIFDPFMGSWTTARACMDLNRNFIGAELSAEYCEIGKQRLRQKVLL